MTAPVQEVDHDYPPIGQTVTIKGLVSTPYLHRNETMQVRWSTFWEAMSDYGYIVPMQVEDTPDADRLFPTIAEVMDLIGTYSSTQPGEKILAIRAEGDTLYVRVGVSLELSREYPVVVPNWESINEAVAEAAASADSAAHDATRAETAADNAQADVNAAANAAAQSVVNQLQNYVNQSGSNAQTAEDAADRAEDAATRAENAADVTDVQLASPTQVGILKLAGDLAGTADAPTVPALAQKYVKPSSGIPPSDLTSGVQTSLGKADTAYQKPGAGIPLSDLVAAVQATLAKADTAYQKPGAGIAKADLVAAVQTSLGLADVAVSAPGNATGWKFWYGTEAQYQALGTKDPKTIYLRSA
ncbi:tail protein [Gordonia phage Clawz]|uniref:Minor tail protein n=1 Tax=Gordonia phage Clawz TaxID=2743910 RepID=A0AAE7K6X6_9CAUD|nr:tail protein [Gordonia phage Clawz]QKY79975.1 minor tail protein [Gordonia phage Clawz]